MMFSLGKKVKKYKQFIWDTLVCKVEALFGLLIKPFSASVIVRVIEDTRSKILNKASYNLGK